MGAFRDFWIGPPSEQLSAPEVRSDVPGPSDPSTATTAPTRGDWQYHVSSGDALGMINVYRAVSIYSTSVMQCSLDAYRDGEQLTKPLILRKPNPDESLQSFLEQTDISLSLNGNFFWRVFRDNQGRVTALRVLNPRDVQIKADKDGNVTGYDYQSRTWTKSEIKHGSLMRVPGDPRGRGPIQAAQAELRGALDTQKYAANWFQEAGVPTGILKTDQRLTPALAAEYREAWEESQGGQRGTAVLGADLSYQNVFLSPEDAQWISVRQFDKTQIATLFGIPANLLLAALDGSAQTYTNVQQSWVEFYKFGLVRHTAEIEAAFSDLLPRGTEVKFNLSALLRPDDTTRWAIHTQALSAGVLSINEVRDIENLAPIPDGDHKTAAEKVAEAQASAPSEDAPDDEEAPADE